MHRFALFLILLLGPLGLFAQTAPTNLGFEAGGTLGAVPPFWSTFTVPSGLAFRATLVSDGCLNGLYCALMTGPANAASTAFGNLSQTVSATAYRGRAVVFRTAVRVQSPGMRAILWLRADRPDGTVALILNSPDITSTEWQYYQLSAVVSSDSQSMIFGILNYGSSSAWVDDGSFQTVDAAVQEGPRAVSDTGLANLTAFTKVLGYVRHFHPSDQVSRTDWDSFTAYGVRAVESAGTEEELASRLQSLFDPIAPTVRVFPSGSRPSLPADLQPAVTTGLQLIRWKHYGVYLSSNSNIYQSVRQTAPAGGQLPAGFLSPVQPYEAPIGRGLSVSVPLTLYADSGGTLPHRPEPPFHCCAYGPDDRATRLAGVVVAWNVAQHFYPYFDVVQTDWPAALADALRGAATDAGASTYFATLSRMWAALHDGHGWVWGPQTNLMAPLAWDWVENQLVITVVKSGAATGLAKGDRVVRINGKLAEDALSDQRQLISGATPQWILYRSLVALAQCPNGARTMQLEIEPFAGPGANRTIEFTCGTDTSWSESRPGVVTELEPGIMYVDINNLTEAAWSNAAASVASAKGVVFDLRGYPQTLTYLQHLGTQTLSSAQWNIPTPAKPDRIDFTFQKSSWSLTPLQPAIAGRRVFLTDGRAVSYAETVMGIVENYKLAEIVGGATAGTNGNINYIYLPGGFRFGFTGMKVLKTDGSQHHGVGIHATIPASRTRKGVAEGRDEVLARGVEVVKGPQPGPAPTLTAVVNAASYAEGPVAPGEIVTIFGTNLGPASVAQTAYDGSGFLGTWAGETRVFFDDIQAPLVYASNTQVSAIVPYQVTANTKIRVEYQLRSSDARTVQVTAAAPGVFTVAGKSQAAVVNQNGSFNSDANPAASGEIVTLFATGAGATSPAGVTGKLPPPGSVPAGDVVVTFGGIRGELQFVGEIAAGVLQVNVKVPATAVSGSAVPLSLSVSGTASPARATVVIK
ncbi:MAG: S41 family peptidase [Candidatus Solibacter sp.]|nr:S41 family peptidase [Candidatus Solibacter sp.]